MVDPLSRTFRAFAAVGALFLVAAVAAPEDQPFRYRELSQAEIVKELFGTVIEGAYANGATFTEALNRDGTSYYEDDRGNSVADLSFSEDLLCFAYRTDDMNGGCFVVFQRSQNCYDFYSAFDGEAFASLSERALGVGWTARVSRQGAASTCPLTPLS